MTPINTLLNNCYELYFQWRLSVNSPSPTAHSTSASGVSAQRVHMRDITHPQQTDDVRVTAVTSPVPLDPPPPHRAAPGAETSAGALVVPLVVLVLVSAAASGSTRPYRAPHWPGRRRGGRPAVDEASPVHSRTRR